LHALSVLRDMKADGLERTFRQGPAVKLCIFIGPTDEYSDMFEPLLPYYMAILNHYFLITWRFVRTMA
jgi:hypothetical protein